MARAAKIKPQTPNPTPGRAIAGYFAVRVPFINAAWPLVLARPIRLAPGEKFLGSLTISEG